jgi:hypothetical protein
MNGHLSISVSLKDTPEILRVINLLQSLLPIEEPKLLPPLYQPMVHEAVFPSAEVEDKLEINCNFHEKTPKELANESRRKKSLFRKRDHNGRWMALTKSRPAKK